MGRARVETNHSLHETRIRPAPSELVGFIGPAANCAALLPSLIGDLQQSAKERLRWPLLITIITGSFLGGCQTQDRGAASHSDGEPKPVPSLQALAVGTWQWAAAAEPDDPNTFLKVQLSADGSWSWSVYSDDPHTNPDRQSGTWFVHDRVLVLRVGESNARLLRKMAFTFDIQSCTPETLALTNSPLGDVTWTRIAQPDAPETPPAAAVPESPESMNTKPENGVPSDGGGR